MKQSLPELIADAIIATVRNGVEQLSLYFAPNGAVGISLTPDPMQKPFALVGHYSGDAQREKIVEDIIASQRESIE